MASTFSTSLKLTLIGDGDQTGTWGQTTNTNLGTLLEQAIVGQTTITMAGADYTLTNLNGALDEARGAVLIITGTQGATFSVIVPAVPKLYMIYNNLTSPQVAYIKMSGGTTTQVPNGQTMYLYCTGVIGASWGVLNYVQNAQTLVSGGSISTNAITCTSLTSSGGIIGTTGAFSGAISGTTITASTQFTGPGTGITGLPLTTGVTGTLPVVNGGTGVTSSTGSGNNVLSTSPTLVTPILGTPQSGTLTNATGLPLTTGVTGTLPVTNGGTGVTTSTGSGNVVLSTSPTLVTPLLGTPTSGNLANCTFPTFNQNTTGNAATATTAVTVSTTVASGAVGTTQTAGDNSTKIATTAYVATAVTNGLGTLGTMSTQNANSVAITGGSITGITDLAVADGGTGQSALTANNVILGNGTSPVSFVAPSTSGLALRSNGTTFTMQKLGLGMSGETWYDVTASRAIGTTYTNSNGYPISVAVGLSHLGGGANIYRVLVNGVGVAYETGNSSNDTADSNTFIVPPGQTYIVETLAGSHALTFWSELY